MTTLNATTTHALDTHYDGWLGILPKDLWDIIFKMAHQSCLQDVHSSVLDKGKDVYGHFVEEYSMKERLPRPSKYVNIKLNQKDWALYDRYYNVPDSSSNKLVYDLYKWARAPTRGVSGYPKNVLKAQCNQNGLKIPYYNMTRKQFMKLLMSI